MFLGLKLLSNYTFSVLLKLEILQASSMLLLYKVFEKRLQEIDFYS